MKQVLTIQGKAKNVFKYTALLAKRQGKKKLKDLSKPAYTQGITLSKKSHIYCLTPA